MTALEVAGKLGRTMRRSPFTPPHLASPLRGSRHRRRHLIKGARAALFPLLVIGLAACSEEAPPAPEVARPVKILEVGSDHGGSRREYPGTIASDVEAQVSFEVPGRIVDFPVDEGQDVKQGKLLVRLDARAYEAELSKALAQLENIRADDDRAEELFEQGVLAQAELDRRRTALRVARADVRSARKGVDDAALHAPTAGRVARKLAREGESIQAKQPVLIFQQGQGAGQLEVRISVPEREVATAAPDLTNAQVTELLQPRVRLEAVPDREMNAAVTEVATSPDAATRTFQVTLRFQSPTDLNVLPGMTATVSIRSPDLLTEGGGRRDALSIPSSAVVSNEVGKPSVWKVEPGDFTVRRVLVELGPFLGERVVVRSGIEAGEWIALTGVHHLHEGAQVSRLKPRSGAEQ